MLTITVPTPDPARLSPYDAGAEAAWLARLGPTAWVLCQWGHSECIAVDAGRQLVVDFDDLRAHLGVKSSVLHNALARLSRFRIIYYDVGRRHVVGDFTLPPATMPAHPVPVHLLPEDAAA